MKYLTIPLLLVLLAVLVSPVMGNQDNTAYLPLVLDTKEEPTPTPTPEPEPNCDWFPCAYIAYLVSRATDDYEYIQIHKKSYNDYVDMTDWILTVEYDQSGVEEILFVFPPWYLDNEYWTVKVQTYSGWENPLNLFMFYDEHQYSWETCVRLYDDNLEFIDLAYKPAGDTYDPIPGNDCYPEPTPTPTPEPYLGPHIQSIHPADNPNDEYLIIYNSAPVDALIQGWYIKSESGKTYTIPSGYIIPAKGTIRIFTGVGTDTLNDLYWVLTTAVWNDPFECASLYMWDDTLLDKVCN